MPGRGESIDRTTPPRCGGRCRSCAIGAIVLVRGLRSGKYLVSNAAQLAALALAVLRHSWPTSGGALRLEPEQGEGGARGGSPAKCAEADPATAAEVADSLARLLAGLDPADRRLIELRVQGFSMAEIAAASGCDPHALRAA